MVKSNSLKFGIAGGIVWALMVLVITIFSNYFPTWETLIRECYGMFGYTPLTALGVILGIIYAFIDGFVLAFVFCWIYNKLK